MSISRADKLYIYHEKNFFKIFNFDKFMMKLPKDTLTITQDDENEKEYLHEYLGEILVTIPSILLMLKKYQTLDDRIIEFND